MSLIANNLQFRYAAHTPLVVDGWSITVNPGEVVGFAGQSGGGKTTFAKMMSGYLSPLGGSVTVDGDPLPRRGRCPVQLIVQHPETAVDPRWRASDIIAEGTDGPVADDLRHAFGIRDEWLTRWPHELSGGELQRLAIVRALAGPTKYLIADELSTMLDANAQAQIWSALLAHTRATGIGVLAISHNSALLDQIADRQITLTDLATTAPVP